MHTISDFLSTDHRHCDDLFAAAEAACGQQDWPRCSQAFADFRQAMEQHLSMEEEVLFPSFEEAAGSAAGPTQVMRLEHEQMRELFEQMAEAVAGQDAAQYLGLSETLLVLMQQHNMKEEQILYHMCDRMLGARTEQVLERMRQLRRA
ncbi:MAG: hemerythrin domain-containing protein [Thiohalobacteraceae bacterium]|nr:hemerythrin domain-containing protein [Gammaproteobacteria bacterium]